MGWRDGSVMKSTYCYGRGPDLNSQHPPWWLTTGCNSSSTESTTLDLPSHGPMSARVDM
ncbi:rCG43393 [Rattus norvegicus]|uniref:RCG43393 n=1 Tax=Rattus norvegicus TaxID=10116 RepID=A6MGR0_RAT|nr:rCG43393 [Rattus norvegicus]